MQAKVAIIGSCVSRDPFGETGISEQFKVIEYFSRTFFASQATSASVNHNFNLEAIKSPFQRKMVRRDLEKNIIPALIGLDFDVLILDFIDDRFDLIKSNNLLITESNEFRAGQFSVDDSTRIATYSDEFEDLWMLGWDLFQDTMSQYGLKSKILINCVFWANIDDKGISFEWGNGIIKANQYLNKRYDFLSSVLQPDQFIKYDNLEFIGKSQHKWGRSPFHYVEEIEEKCLAAVMDFHSRK